MIIDSAIRLADTDGLDAVTIRRVAADNAVTPMALYWHFRDKGELLDAIAERIFADVRIPDTDDLEWAQALAAVLSAFLAAMRPHPNTAVLVLTRVFASEPGLVLAERVLDLLCSAGFSVDQASQIGGYALNTLVTLVTMESGAEPGLSPDAREDAVKAKRDTLLALSPDQYPTLVTCADALTVDHDHPAYDNLGVELLIGGIAGARQSAIR